MPELYFIRHGLAGEFGTYVNDADRPLTEAGQRKTEAIAQRLVALNVHVERIVTSPYVRAAQTAEILKRGGVGDRLEISEHLAPDGDFSRWLVWLAQWQHSNESGLALVGHEPNFSEWAERLIWGESKGQIILKKAGIIGLNLPPSGSPVGQCSLFWLTPPRLLL